MGRPRPRMPTLAALAAAALVVATTAVAAQAGKTRPQQPVFNHKAALVGRYRLQRGADKTCPLVADVTAPLTGWSDQGRLQHDTNDGLYEGRSTVEASVFRFDDAVCDAARPLTVSWTHRRDIGEHAYGFMDIDQAPWLCGEDLSLNGIFVFLEKGEWTLSALGLGALDCTYVGNLSAVVKSPQIDLGGTVGGPPTGGSTTGGGGVVILDPQGSGTGADAALPTPSPDGSASCFPAAATVELADGSAAALGSLLAGSTVRVGAGAHSDVFGWSHRQSGGRHAYVRLTHRDGAAAAAAAAPRDLLLSPGGTSSMPMACGCRRGRWLLATR
eukprot:TRINITY_DN4728_c0_g1_i1.p1 TRINITY_DN4728_c0_g1~~TRINITY_DN4728_c0_g1_i1.p1  ORF type:complete len:329 (+),score=86.55 TRINITY_DN4728_c0_g1_i1:205-1191(+)